MSSDNIFGETNFNPEKMEKTKEQISVIHSLSDVVNEYIIRKEREISSLRSENEHLRSEVERLKKEREWISVADKLPTYNEEVLTITSDGWYRVIEFGSSGRKFPSQVTHWMPLPESPNNQNKETED